MTGFWRRPTEEDKQNGHLWALAHGSDEPESVIWNANHRNWCLSKSKSTLVSIGWIYESSHNTTVESVGLRWWQSPFGENPIVKMRYVTVGKPHIYYDGFTRKYKVDIYRCRITLEKSVRELVAYFENAKPETLSCKI